MIPFSPPRMDSKITDAVVEALHSGWITTGPRTKDFEREISAYCGNEKTLCVSSGSAGLELMLRWFGVGPGDEVILPAYTYTATANVIMHVGAKPIFVDVNADFNMNAALLKKAITSKTKVVMPVDIGGWPCDYDSINQIVKEDNIKNLFKAESEEQKLLNRILVLSDAAHSLGAEYHGKKTGSLCDVTVFSFHAVKNLTTAEGGAVALNLPSVFDLDDVYKVLNIKCLHGQSKDALAKTQIGNWRYDVLEAGYKFNMTDIMAAMGLVELSRYEDDMLVKRKYIFDKYTAAFSQSSDFQCPIYETQHAKSSYHVYMLRIPNATETQRDAIIQEIFKQEVSVNVHFIPIPMLSFYKNLNYNIADYPQALTNFQHEISLPVYYDLTDEMMDQVIDAVKNATEKVLSHD